MKSTLITERFWLNREVVQIQMDLLSSFAKSLAYYRAIHQDYERISGSKEFWCHTLNTCLLRSVTDWCIIFGPDSNESHWKKVSEEHRTEVSNEIKPLILSVSGFSEKEWHQYWKSLTEFRHQYVVHRVPEYDEPVPHMTKAMDIGAAYFEWLKDQLRPSRNEPKTLTTMYAEYQIEVLVILKQFLQKI